MLYNAWPNQKEVYKNSINKTGGCGIENVPLEYGRLFQTVYKSTVVYLTSPISKEWNRVKNIGDNDPDR